VQNVLQLQELEVANSVKGDPLSASHQTVSSSNKKGTKSGLNPWFVTGYTDGEGCFSIKFARSVKALFGFKISLIFSISAAVNPLNLQLLQEVQRFFGGFGCISILNGSVYFYEVNSLKALGLIRAHFIQYPLQSTKLIHFQLWCMVMDKLQAKEHITLQGFLSILSINAVFPKGLTANILAAFPNIISIIKPEFINPTGPLNPYWIAGFVQADGSFGLNFTKSPKNTLGHSCQPQFRIAQHRRDLALLQRIIETLGCGTLVTPSADRDVYGLSVSNHRALFSIIIPFFIEHPVSGAKALDFQDFCTGLSIIHRKEHLTPAPLRGPAERRV
jgi:hypothetical protein